MSSQEVHEAAANILPELRDHPQYQVLRELGQGGMGVVYLARNKLMDRLEVLKVVKGEYLGKGDAAERFLREIRSAAKLNHPNIVSAYSAFQAKELLVFAMEYVEGITLAQLVQTQGRLPVPNACYYIQQICLGLQHALDKEMVHRDIKPQNLILAREGKKQVIKILDFGLAKATREGRSVDRALTATGMMLGTPDYIAPEQTLDAAKADHRADIYGLGCTFFYLLAGRAPFEGGSLYAVLQAHHQKSAPALDKERDDVPPELAAVVAKMMAKDPAARYQKAAAIATALTPFIKGGIKPVHIPVAPPPPPPAVQGTLLEATETMSRALLPAPVEAARKVDAEPEVARARTVPPRRARRRVEAEESGMNPLLIWGLVGGGFALLLLIGAVAAIIGSLNSHKSSSSGQVASDSESRSHDLGRSDSQSAVPSISGISAISSGPGPSGAAGDDLERIQGTWIIMNSEIEGKAVEDVSTGKMTFRGNLQNLATRTSPSNEVRFWLDPAKTPKQYDVTDKNDKVIYRGIYQIDGDSLSMCWNSEAYSAARPEYFRAPKDSKRLSLTLTRSAETRARSIVNWDGDLPGNWSLISMKQGVRIWSDRLYAAAQMPKELEDGVLLMRGKDEKDWSPGAKFRALRDCTAYVVVKASTQEGRIVVDAATFNTLAEAGWSRINGNFEPTIITGWNWVVLKKSLRKGDLLGAMKPGVCADADIFFIFK